MVHIYGHLCGYGIDNFKREQMKKLTLFFVLINSIMLIFSCDDVFDYNYRVKNSTNEDIIIIYETGNKKHINNTITIEKDEEKLIHTSHAAGGKTLLGQDIWIVFDKFIIKKGDSESQRNYRDNQIWQYKELSPNIGEYTLIVDSSHFIFVDSE